MGERDALLRHPPHYGLGLSERRLGAFLATKRRSEFVVSTKVGRLLRPDSGGTGLDLANDFVVPADTTRVWDLTADGVRRSLDDSLTRLGLDRVDVVYVHDPERHDLEQGLAEALPAAAALRDEGVVSAVGVGSMDTAALAAAARTGLPDLLMVAGRLTLLDQSAATEVLPPCRSYGVGVVAAAVFNSGLLATDEPADGALFDYEPAPPALLDRARRIAALCRDHGVPLPAAALQYPLRETTVAAVVVGGATPDQVRDNGRRLGDPVPAALWDDLRDEGLVAA